MPQVNLSDLNGPDLRRLLDATRGRGNAALSYTILQEMAARREGRGQRGLFLTRRPAEPRIVAVDLGDPMEREDDLPPMPHWRPPAESQASASAGLEPPAGPDARKSRRRKAQPSATGESAEAAPDATVEVEPAAPPPLEMKLPRSVWDDDPEPPEDKAATSQDWDVRLGDPGAETRGPARGGLAAGLAVGIAVGVVLGWSLSGIPRRAPLPPAAAPAGPIMTAALDRAPAPVAAPAPPIAAEPEATPDAPSDPAADLPSPEPHEVAANPPAAVEVAAEAHGEAIEPSQPAHQIAQAAETAESPAAAVAVAASVEHNACASEPTPADRKICSDARLRGLQRELRRAYAEALQAHRDRSLLRERQLAWRDARDSVSDPTRLAMLYEQRIRKLNAATAAARQQR